MTYLLDTDICISVLRQHAPTIQRLQLAKPSMCIVSVITVYELYCGLSRARDPQREQAKVQRFLSLLTELPFDHASAQAAAVIRGDLERRGQVIGPYDLLLAGQAVARDLILVTNNLREFQRIGNLSIEAW